MKSTRKCRAVHLIIVGVPMIICGCLLSVVVAHDYAYKLDKSIKWSHFSSFDNATDVKAVLERNLILGQAKTVDVLLFLAQKGVEDCSMSDETVVCWTPAHEPVINPENPLDIRGYNLFTEWDYRMSFQFSNGKLAEIEVSKESTGP